MNINATLLVQSIVFIGFVLMTMRYIWPLILEALDEREATIRAGIDHSAAAEKKLKEADSQADKVIRDAQSQVDLLLREAKKDAASIVKQAQEHAVHERNRIVEEGYSQIDRQAALVKKEIASDQLSHLQSLCRQLFGQEVDPKKLTKELAGQFVSQEGLRDDTA